MHGGHPILGGIARSTVIDLYYKRSMGNPPKPQPRRDRRQPARVHRRLLDRHLRRPGKPKVRRHGNLVRLAVMPLGDHANDSGIGGGSTLYRFRPVMRRPKRRPNGCPGRRTLGYRGAHEPRDAERLAQITQGVVARPVSLAAIKAINGPSSGGGGSTCSNCRHPTTPDCRHPALARRR